MKRRRKRVYVYVVCDIYIYIIYKNQNVIYKKKGVMKMWMIKINKK